MDGDLDAILLERISSFEKELLTPLVDRSSLVVFNCRWTSLNDDLQAALKANALKSSTITIAYSLADRVARMIKTFMDLEALAERLMTSLLGETSSTQEPSLSTYSSTHPVTALPPYIKPSYDWLVDNLHDPYPSITVRETIAQQARAARKDVDNWFKDARKRIGWNEARKTFFSNKRADIVDAATRFYANDEKLSLSQGAEHALVSVMKNAKDLYCDKFDETLLVTTLASVVKDLTPATKAEAQAERSRQARLKKKDPYPSPPPDRSPEPSQSLPIPCNEKVVTIATQSVSNKSRKRRNLSVDLFEFDRNEEGRPEKRSRLATPSSPGNGLFPLGLPSPAPSMDEPLQLAEAITAPSLPSPSSVSSSRKRSLSEADEQAVSKRSRHLPAEPRLPNVSDSLPLSNDNLLFDQTSFDGWFRQIFDPPEVGDVSPSGFSVELGDFSDFLCETSTRSYSTLPEPPEPSCKPPTLEVTDIPTVLDESWNKSHLDWNGDSSLLLDDNSLVNIVDRESISEPLGEDLANFQVSSQTSCANEFSLSNSSVVGPVMIPLNIASNVAWDFPESSLDRNNASIVGKHHTGFGSNERSLASFNFPDNTDFLASLDVFPLHTSSSQDKLGQEKEKEFRDACEKAQRLALELQQGDVFV
ncbi:hypothetical protein C0993_006434 [Termitomyces sp. T159_Od127]|nr:hypothetical protein C0993_006434 [Termitomyces sp. T159_Od127]